MPHADHNKWKVFFLVAVSIFMSTLDSSIVNVALPYMMQYFKTDMATIQWVVLIYLTTVSSLLLTFGRLSDIQGKKKVYVLGFAVFATGSLMCALSGTPALLILARAIQGIGAAMLMACSPALVVDAFPEKERGKALGMIGAVVASGLTTGPVLGGIILEYFSWQFIFYINIPIGAAAVVAGMMVLTHPDFSKGSNEPMDKTGSILMILVISSLVVVMSHLSKWGWFSPGTISLSLLCLLSAFGFVMTELKSGFPLFDIHLISIRLFVFPIVASAILFAGLFILVFMMPFYLTYPCDFSASKTGGIMITPFLFLLLVSPVAGMLYDKIGSRGLATTGMGLLAIALFSLASVEPAMGAGAVVWRMAVAGIGTALFVSPNNTAALSAVPFHRRGIASGAVATSRNLGMVLGVALAGLVFSTAFSGLSAGSTLEHYTVQMEPYFMAGFKRTMVVGGCLAAAGIAVSFARGRESFQNRN